MIEFGQPCPWCQVRPDVACRHRPADPSYTPPVQKSKERDPYTPPKNEMSGLNFRTRNRPR